MVNSPNTRCRSSAGKPYTDQPSASLLCPLLLILRSKFACAISLGGAALFLPPHVVGLFFLQSTVQCTLNVSQTHHGPLIPFCIEKKTSSNGSQPVGRGPQTRRKCRYLTLQFVTVAKWQLWSSNENNSMVGGQHSMRKCINALKGHSIEKVGKHCSRVTMQWFLTF